jgi:cobalt-zinc-cadmium resistance protein CzcA
MALSTSTGAEVQRPLASVVIGGLFTSTLLTLLLLPVLYEWIFEKESPAKAEQDGDGVGEHPATA